MRNLITILITMVISIAVTAQSVSPELTTSAGGYYNNGNISLSWTLGEIATETFSNGGVILTQGFQQPVSVTIHGIDLHLLVFLEGPFSGSQMTTSLNSGNKLPLLQPYNIAPWNYAGTESVGSIPNINVVDWILIELRDAANPETATPATTIETQAGFLLADGSVVDIDGNSVLQFPSASFSQNLYVAVWHRNHLGIISANGITETGGVYNYDFTTGQDKVFGGAKACTQLDTGVWGMTAGDGNSDGQINNQDKNDFWLFYFGNSSYNNGDFDMNGAVNNADKDDNWTPNAGKGNMLPE